MDDPLQDPTLLRRRRLSLPHKFHLSDSGHSLMASASSPPHDPDEPFLGTSSSSPSQQLQQQQQQQRRNSASSLYRLNHGSRSQRMLRMLQQQQQQHDDDDTDVNEDGTLDPAQQRPSHREVSSSSTDGGDVVDRPNFRQAYSSASLLLEEVKVSDDVLALDPRGQSQISSPTTSPVVHVDDDLYGAARNNAPPQRHNEALQEMAESLAWRRQLKDCLHYREYEQAELIRIVRRRFMVTQQQQHQQHASSSVLSSSSSQRQLQQPSQQSHHHPPPEVVLISGGLGCGKTRLAQVLQRPVTELCGGYFVQGKFDQLNLCKPAPYTAFCAAFSQFTQMVQRRGPDAVYDMRKAIYNAIGNEACVLTRMIPALEVLCGPANPPTGNVPEALSVQSSSMVSTGSGSDLLRRPGQAHSTNSTTPSASATSNTNKAKADDAIQRFVFVFKSFLNAICSPQQPLVLLLDDIHWADPCSLDVLTSIVTDRTPSLSPSTTSGNHHNNNGGGATGSSSFTVLTSNASTSNGGTSANNNGPCGLLLVCTCDNDKVSSKSYLSLKLREMEDHGTIIRHLTIGNLPANEVHRLLGQALDWPVQDTGSASSGSKRGNGGGENGNADAPENVEHGAEPTSSTLHRTAEWSLTEIVMQQTKGNPSDIIEFLCWLRESDLLYRDEITSAWRWDVDEIGMTINTRQVRDYVVDKLEQLPSPVQDVLKVSACLGPYVDKQLLEFVLSVPVTSALHMAAARGAIMTDGARGDYVFEHDGIQAAAYALIPEVDRERFHLEIGRRMWRRMDEETVDRHLFTLLSQLNLGKGLISREGEKIAVATLCLHAGIKAARSSTFRTALTYLELGISLLGNDSWRRNYELTLALHNAAAEMAMCTSKFERMDELVDIVLHNAKLLLDKTQAYATRIYALGVSNKQRQAIETGFEVLNGLGEPLPKRFCRRAANRELRSVRKLLRGKSDEQLLRMPIMVDKEKLACLQILNLNFLNALLTQAHFVPFITLKMMKLTLKYGASVFASATFANYGMLSITMTHDIETAYRYGELGKKFLDRFEAKEYMPRVHAAFYGCIYPWRQPLRGAVGPLLEGYEVGLQTGDMEGAFLCANLYCMLSLEAGAPIPVVEREWEKFRRTMANSRHQSFLKLTLPQLQIIHHLNGKSSDPLAAKGDLLDFDEAIRLAKERNDDMGEMVIHSCQMILAFTFNDLDMAEQHIPVLRMIRRMPPNFKKVTTGFFGGLVILACARDGRRVRRNLRVGRFIIRIMDYLATQTPHNCLDKLFLLEAEYASVVGKNAEAYKKYTCALAMAKDSGFPYYTAIAYELASRHLLRLSSSSSPGGGHPATRSEARQYMEEACRYYREFGAMRKVEHLEAEYHQLFGNDDPAGEHSTNSSFFQPAVAAA